ncbi:MAG: penicillin-binding protein 3 [Melioribacteraceae bacterium]|nr:MAG: penicillin-binding protein 3 [Melioribacteraceae bacterium]
MIKTRALLVILFIFAGFFAITAHLFNIQVVKHDLYREIAFRQQDKQSNILAERGMIKDRTGKTLSYTKRDYSYYASLRQFKTESAKKKVASKFAEVFGKSESHYLNLLNSDKSRVCIEKKAPFEKSLKLREFIVDGLSAEEDYTRVYPENRLASHVLGYVNTNLEGVNGVEKYFEDYLKGEDGLLFVQRDVLGKTVGVVQEYSYEPVPGDVIELTIDGDYQKILEEELAKGLNKYEGVSATGIVMDPNTGAILAMANIPDYNPGSYGKFTDFERKNRAIMDIYEPGSTIKPLVIGMMMEENLVNLNENIETENGTFTYNRVKISDTHPSRRLSVRGVLYESSNIGMVKLSERIEENTFYKYLRDFGFGNSSSIDLPGESSGFLKKPKNFSRISKAFISHGYEISVTPLQMLTAFCATINGGYLNQPYIVNRIKKESGETIKQFEKVTLRTVLSKEISDTLRNVLVNVVEEGTGSLARLDDIYVGGKTGTAQKWTADGYSTEEYNSSFIGFFPAKAPKVAVFVLVNSPKVGFYGGRVAAPIFKEISERIVNSDINIAPYKEKIIRKDQTIDNLLASVEDSRNDVGITRMLNVTENGSTVKKRDFSNLPKDIMPDLRGYSVREVMAVTSMLGIKCSVTGSGRVSSQSIEPGEKIAPGQTCKIECKMED